MSDGDPYDPLLHGPRTPDQERVAKILEEDYRKTFTPEVKKLVRAHEALLVEIERGRARRAKREAERAAWIARGRR